jgi:hypothetical protein
LHLSCRHKKRFGSNTFFGANNSTGGIRYSLHLSTRSNKFINFSSNTLGLRVTPTDFYHQPGIFGQTDNDIDRRGSTIAAFGGCSRNYRNDSRIEVIPPFIMPVKNQTSQHTPSQRNSQLKTPLAPCQHHFCHLQQSSLRRHICDCKMSNNINGGGRSRNALSSVDFYRRVPKDLTEVGDDREGGMELDFFVHNFLAPSVNLSIVSCILR